MATDRDSRIDEICSAAMALDGPARDAFVAAACAGDEGLRREVDSLLRYQSKADGFMAEPALAVAAQRLGSAGDVLIGRQLGAFRVHSLLGAGGMGEVYRARDTTLGRDVALKVLPALFTADPDRLARFEREAHTLATLNDPHIGAIYGLEEHDRIRVLVLEIVEGSTLADRIALGALSNAEALSIAGQTAGALEAAHEKGIIHRDLKPANIKITPDDIVKVLDFGLAKVWSREPGAPNPTQPPVVTVGGTGAGVILGTAAYMSPEQARGQVVDKRTDIWAFGCVLYEMLTGRAAFAGATDTDTLAAIIEREPDWTALPPNVPRPVRALLRRCLEKDLKRRTRDIGDARLDIENALSDPYEDPPIALPHARTRNALAWASILVLVGLTAAATMAWGTRSRSIPPETTRTLVSVAPTDQSPGGNPLEQQPGRVRPTRTAVALSPDGKTLVFGAIWGGDQRLYVRAMDRLGATPLAGTDGGVNPFFSPDGQWVGFYFSSPRGPAEGELRKVRLGGGPAVTLCRAASIFGASWGSDGTIVFATARNGGLWRVPAAGGTPEALTTPQPGEHSHRLPHMLPGGHAVIFTILKAANQWDDTQVVVRSVATGEQTVLITGGSDGRYVSTGHLVYVRLGTLMAVPFDPVRLAVTGNATGLIDGVMQAANGNLSDMSNTLAGQFTVSDTGALIYVTGGAVPMADRSLAWVDRKGASKALPAQPGPYVAPRLSRDGQRVAVSTQGVRQVWSYDIGRNAFSAVTVDGQSSYGIFAPDGKRVVFRLGGAGGADNLYWKAADGSGTAEPLTTSARSQTPASWSPDGGTLAFVQEGDTLAQQFFQFDIWVLSIRDRKTRAVVQTAAHESFPEFSPDGHWLAYVSNQSGRQEVYVQPYPGPGERHPISTNGGEQPAWSRNGRELFYVQAGASGSRKLMSVRIRTAPAFLAGTPETLFERVDLQSNWGRSYDVAPDGQRFLITVRKEQPMAPAQMIFVQNWTEELKRMVPTK
jgi:eukaryotic-like serine/threonine-protein kinase